ncbi:MAG TPA: bifunctional riboflavin kinase/FAD synthetase [Acidobacteriota bacterium]|nr:bifunctional riboflavin kinase/FAD synthetase [Acidobacteriota bacterium]
MQIVRHIDDPTLAVIGSVVTLGNFDGIHLGHQALIGGAVADAKKLGVPSVVLTFEPHPLKVLAPERAPQMLLSHKDKMQLLQSLGAEIVVVQKFDLPFAQISAENFVRGVLIDRLKIRKIWVGQDLRFGQGRRGSVADLRRWGAELGFAVSTVDAILVDNARVSSSRIRQLVGDGYVDRVEPMLGRYHFISGHVGVGHRRGRELGFPTANIATRAEVLPLDGIYATLFHFGNRQWLSVSSIGINPTFGAGPRTVESFIFSFDQDIYGEAVRLSFVKRIREEKKFSSADELSQQIRRDVEAANGIFRQLNLRPSV